MGKIRNYVAYGYNGDARVSFQFESEYRANSKANWEEANRKYKKKHGHRIKIVNTVLCDYIDGEPFVG